MENIQYYPTQHNDLSLIDAKYHTFAFQRHYHLDFHLGLITQGEQKFHFQGKSYHAGQGQIVMMPPDALHDGESKHQEGYGVNVFAIEPQFLSNIADLKKYSEEVRFNQLLITEPHIFRQLFKLHSLLRTNNISKLAQDCFPFEVLNQLFDRYTSIERQKVIPLGNQSLESLRDYLMANLDQVVRLETLSNLCQLSPTQFQRHFKAKTGMTPYAWFARLRLEQGMKLLQSGKNVTDVAHQIGFYDQAHFSKAFKQTYGIPPSQITG